MPDISTNNSDTLAKISADLRTILTQQAREEERMSNMLHLQEEQKGILGEIQNTLMQHNEALARHSSSLQDICVRLGEFKNIPEQVSLLQERDRAKTERIENLEKTIKELTDQYHGISIQIAKWSALAATGTTFLGFVVTRFLEGL